MVSANLKVWCGSYEISTEKEGNITCDGKMQTHRVDQAQEHVAKAVGIGFVHGKQMWYGAILGQINADAHVSVICSRRRRRCRGRKKTNEIKRNLRTKRKKERREGKETKQRNETKKMGKRDNGRKEKEKITKRETNKHLGTWSLKM